MIVLNFGYHKTPIDIVFIKGFVEMRTTLIESRGMISGSSLSCYIVKFLVFHYNDCFNVM